MSMPAQDGQASFEITRYFTRPGREPLTLVPFETRLVDGAEMRVPVAWSPNGLRKLAKSLGDKTPADWIRERAAAFASAGREAGFFTTSESESVASDEFAWILARSMGWLSKSDDNWVGLVNLAPFCEPVTTTFELEGLKQTVKLLVTLAAAKAALDGTPSNFSLAWTNLGGIFLSSAIPYDSPRAVGIGGSVAAMVLGASTSQSALLAKTFPTTKVEQSGVDTVLSGLAEAKKHVLTLPPTRQISPPQNSLDRWQSEALSSLEKATNLVKEHGLLNTIPVTPNFPEEGEEWLGTIARGAEPVATLHIPDMVSRPEVRNSLRALGLSENQKGPLLSAITNGGDLEATGLSKEKASSLRTALDSLTFHPNAQIAMASAVAPFIAGPIQHKVHLPEGVPMPFLTSLKEYAAGLNLSSLTFGGSAEDSSLNLSDPEEADEPVVEASNVEDSLEAASVETESAPEAPEATEAIVGEAKLETESQPEEEQATVTPEEIQSPDSTPTPVESEESEQPAAEDASIEAAPVAAGAVVAAGALGGAIAGAAHGEETSSTQEEPVVADEETSEVPAEAGEAETEPKPDLAEAETAPEPESPEPSTPAADQILSVPSQTFRLQRGEAKYFVHAILSPTGRLEEVSVTFPGGDAAEKVFLDAVFQAVTTGLKGGATIQSYAKDLTYPPLVAEVLKGLSHSFPG